MDWSNIVSAGVGAVAALAGGALTPVITSRRGHRDWRRGKLAEGSERLSAAALDVMFKFNDDRYMPPKRDSEDLDFQRLTAAVGMIALYGSHELGSAAFDVLDAYEALRLSTDEGLGRRDELAHELALRGGKVTMLARRDLDLPQVTVEPAWHGRTVPVLAQPALARKLARENRVRRRTHRILRANRMLLGVYTIAYLVARARRRRHSRKL